MPKRFIAYACVALICIFGIIFFSDSSEDLLGPPALPELSAQPYAVIRNASTRYHNTDGTLSYLFKSSELRHFRKKKPPQHRILSNFESVTPDNDVDERYTEVDAPKIIFFENDIPWKIRAESAHIAQSDIITLIQDVVVYHENEQGLGTTMRTSKLRFDPKQKLASTQQPVTIESPLGQISATGMLADIAKRTISLHNDVKGHHQPRTLGR